MARIPALRKRPIPEGRGCRDHPRAQLGWIRASNDVLHAVDHCPDCDRVSSYYSRAEIAAADVCETDLPVLRDYLSPEPCVVCGKMGVEEAHWWPKALEAWCEDFDAWPTGWLCRRHHDEWHRNVTPSDTVCPTVTLGQLQARQSTTVRDVQDKLRERLRKSKEAAA